MFIRLRKSRAFTLIEVLISLTLFAFISAIAVTLLVNGLRSAKRIQAQIYLYSEAQALMDQIARDVQGNTVDYEAYYSRNVLGDTGWDTPNYGYYAQSFFNPGLDGLTDGPYGDSVLDGLYGTTCYDGTSYPENCDVPYDESQDEDTGTHPFDGIDEFTGYTDDPVYMNAFCEGTDRDGSANCSIANVPFTDELILINGAGDTRIIYVKELLDASTTEYGLSRLVMSGTDTDNDGIEDSWACTTDYTCTDTGLDLQSVPVLADFSPLSPANISILSFDILISPLEDPYRGFGEEAAQVQPQITIVMNVSLSDVYGSGLLGDVPSILLQRTISTGVYTKVLSYE